MLLVMSGPTHHSVRGFRNPHTRDGHGGAALANFLWEWAGSKPSGAPPTVERPDLSFLQGNRSVPTATWLGHASFLLQLDGLNILTDPHLSPRVSPFTFAGPERLIPLPIDHANLPPIDVVLLSHDHYDHLDAPTLRWLADAHDPAVIAPLGHAELLAGLGCRNVTELDWWVRHRRRGFSVTAVPVQHFSGRGLRDRNRRLWCGYVFEADGRKVFFAGDTGYSPDFVEIGRRFAPIDLALIPIGAYAPRDLMRSVHVDPAEAVQIHQDIGSRRSLAMHWGTFRLTLEPLDEPPLKLQAAREAAGLSVDSFVVPQPGETVYW